MTRNSKSLKRLALLFFLYLLPMAAIQLLFACGTSSPTPQKTSATSPAVTLDSYQSTISPLVSNYCLPCHQGPEPKAGINLQFTNAQNVQDRLNEDPKLFDRMARQLSTGNMPPDGHPKPTAAQRELLLTWLHHDLLEPYAAAHSTGQVARVRRLSKVEYANTVRDLFYFKDFKADDLPPDDLGYGFDNIADLLSVSTNHLEMYLKTAEQALAQLDATAKVSPNWAKNDKTYWEPDDGVFLPIKNVELRFNNNQTRVRLVLEKFMPRAYRRPVKKEEIDRMLAFAQLSLAQEGESFVRPKSVYAPLRAAINSPYFLYRIEEDPEEGTAPINEYELASRLSYFLWSSMPDDELFALAEKHELRNNLDAQVHRMLKDPKARALTENFAEQWLHLAALKRATPDPKLFPAFNDALRQDMRQETELFLKHVVDEDCSVMDLLDADYTFLNERLAQHYNIAGITGNDFRMVKLDPQSHRGGLLTQGSILTLTSPPTRTSPVKRGVWILQTLFNDPPSPPPADVPPLETPDKPLTGTVRQVLEAHRLNTQCAGCHAKIDPFGLALENFDGIGMWRTAEAGKTIDASGTLPSGQQFRDLPEFRALLAAKKDDFRKGLIQELLIYALGKGLEHADQNAVPAICATAASQQDKFSSVILAIVNHDLFQKRTATGH